MYRNQEAALDHGLNQAHHLQGDGLSTGVRPADDQHALLPVKGQVLGLHGQSLAAVGEQQQGVVGLEKFNSQFLDNVWSNAVYVKC